MGCYCCALPHPNSLWQRMGYLVHHFLWFAFLTHLSTTIGGFKKALLEGFAVEPCVNDLDFWFESQSYNAQRVTARKPELQPESQSYSRIWAAAKGVRKRACTSLILRLFAFLCVCSCLSAFWDPFQRA